MNPHPVMEPVEYGGWPHNLRLANDTVELVITLDVGPRIIRYAPLGGRNILREFPHELGQAGEPGFRMRGGHRFWTAPEDPARTYVPDNAPVAHRIEGATVIATTATDARFGLEKTLAVRLASSGSGVTVVHRLCNRGPVVQEVSVWALTVLASHGTAIIPLPLGHRHPQAEGATAADFAPHLAMNFWPYFRFSDPRLRFGERFIQIQHDPARSSTKLGIAHRPGWSGYWNDGLFFVKQAGYVEGATYPDGGSSFECYTDGEILELETLSPLVKLKPGDEVTHTEKWALFSGLPSPISENIIDQAFFPLVSTHL